MKWLRWCYLTWYLSRQADRQTILQQQSHTHTNNRILAHIHFRKNSDITTFISYHSHDEVHSLLLQLAHSLFSLALFLTLRISASATVTRWMCNMSGHFVIILLMQNMLWSILLCFGLARMTKWYFWLHFIHHQRQHRLCHHLSFHSHHPHCERHHLVMCLLLWQFFLLWHLCLICMAGGERSPYFSTCNCQVKPGVLIKCIHSCRIVVLK